MGLAQPEAQDVKDFIADLMQRPDREPHHDPGVTRDEAVLSLPSPHEDVSTRVLVSVCPSYSSGELPATAPPQLQLLSRYVGAFGADASLFSAILRTFISSTSGVEWVPDAVCVFDSLQNVLDQCAAWYGDRLSADAAGAMVRADTHPEHQNQTAPPPSLPVSPPDPVATELRQGIEIFITEPINDRKIAFVGRACAISDPSEVPIILAHLLSDRRITRAAHPVINAWQCQVGSVLHQGSFPAAGGRLAHLLHILEVDNVLVVVTRYFGGIHLGPDRFKHINQVARNALDLGGFLDTPAKGMVRGRHR
ncbi:ribosomal protein S5 domain 2-type protein [Mycena olivaceomarginata]|nr:ribosomal protein S5 domain 2-type protein [Mycena olivaceomarginata]